MGKWEKDKRFDNLPACAVEFIRLVIKKMRYRRKVRLDVQHELAAHFEDQLKDCATDKEKEQKARQLISEFGDAKLLAVLLRRAKKRCRPLWQKAMVRSIQALGVVFLYLILCVSPLLVGRPTISVDYVERLNELVRAGRDEADNARPYYEKAVELYIKPPQWLDSSKIVWPADFNDVEFKSLAVWLENNQKAFEALRTAAEYPYYWNRYQRSKKAVLYDMFFFFGNVTPDNPQHRYRHLAYAMRWQICYEVYNGDIDSALKDCLVLQKFGKHLQGKGLLDEQLQGISIETFALDEIRTILDKCDVSADALKMAQEELARQFDEQELIINLYAEKLFYYDFIQRTFTDDGKGGGRVLIEGLPIAVGDWKGGLVGFAFFNYPDRREVTQRIDRLYQHAEQLLRITPLDAGSEAEQEKFDEIVKDSFLLKLLALSPISMNGLNRFAWGLKTHRKGLLTVLAILRYQKEKSRYPARLDELVGEGYLDKLPMDPYSASPLVYKKVDDDFLLYSVGSNFKDDGGVLEYDGKGRPKMWAGNGDTVFWPVPEFRQEPKGEVGVINR